MGEIEAIERVGKVVRAHRRSQSLAGARQAVVATRLRVGSTRYDGRTFQTLAAARLHSLLWLVSSEGAAPVGQIIPCEHPQHTCGNEPPGRGSA